MELKICCDATVKLDKMSNVNGVHCQVSEYELKGDTLNGNIQITGNYIKDSLEETFDFEENVPFTLVFKDRNYSIDNIDIQDFTHQEIINQGIECNFNILVEYSPKKLEGEDEEEDDFGESMTPEEITTADEVVEVPLNEEVPGIVEMEAFDEELDDEELKEEINQKYDNLLKEVLESRDDNFFEEEKEKKVLVRSGEKKEECKSVIGNIKNSYISYRVYYPGKETEIEKICKAEKISIEKLYNDNKNTDYINKKRIIIK